MSSTKDGELEGFSSQRSDLQCNIFDDRVESWVKQSQEFHQRNIGGGEIRKCARNDDGNYMPASDEDDPDIDDLLLWDKPNKPKKKYLWTKVPLLLKCEWRNCSHENPSVEDFVKHVSFHIPEVEVQTDDEENDVLGCLWESCGFESTNDKEFVRHVNFHAYHTKLKCIGQKMMDLMNFPKCSLNPESRNLLPELPEEFLCEWKGCCRIFNNSQMFFFHVTSHSMSYKSPRTKQKRILDIPCGWIECPAKFSAVNKLTEHLKSHTLEKLCACPGCGGLFSCATKLQDHCISQTNSKPDFKCTSCFKYFASERLLRDHMRRHINRYKCTFCDMTCPSPSNLRLHIRFRHLNAKPYKCGVCKFGAKSYTDLQTHMLVHEAQPHFKCSVEGCDFACRTLLTLNKHKQNKHNAVKPIFCCHVCNEQFPSGGRLTKHLFKIHDFQWTPGHSRFTYTRNEDGFFRLKPFRLETLEVTQEILQAEIDEHPGSLSEVCGSQYTLRHMSGLVSGGMNANSRTGKSVLISIDEVDKRGGVVRREVIETEEVPVPLGSRSGTVVWNYSDGDSVVNTPTNLEKVIKLG